MRFKTKLTGLLAVLAVGLAITPPAKADSRSGYAYAYNIRVDKTDPKHPVVTYKVSADVTETYVDYAIDGAWQTPGVKATVAANLTDCTATLDLSNVKSKAKISFRVYTVSNKSDVLAPTKIAGPKLGWMPFSVSINNGPDSPTFGQIVTTEECDNGFDHSQATYIDSRKNDGIGQGLYVFSARMDFQKAYSPVADMKSANANAENTKNGFNGRVGSYHKVRFSPDGTRLFVAGAPTKKVNGADQFFATGIYEVDPTDLSKAATTVVTGCTVDASTGEV